MDYTGFWQGAVMVSGGIVAALAMVALMRRLIPRDVLRQGHEATGNMLSIVGTLYAVLLGLIVVDAMVRFERAMAGVREESNCLADIFLLSGRFPEPYRGRLAALCRAYAEEVVHVDAPDARGQDERRGPQGSPGDHAGTGELRADDRE